MTGTNMQHIPYKGSAGVLADVIAGQIIVTIDNMPPYLPQVKAGKLRALAATSPVKDMPQITTFASLGMPQVSLEVFNAVLGPPNLPRSVMERLEPAYRRVMTDPKMVEQLEKQGYSMLYEDSATLGARIKRELAVVQEVFRKAGMKAGD